jgi:hypothetical protein
MVKRFGFWDSEFVNNHLVGPLKNTAHKKATSLKKKK